MRHRSSCSSPAPLTSAEQELQLIKITEVLKKSHELSGGFTDTFKSVILMRSSCDEHKRLCFLADVSGVK